MNPGDNRSTHTFSPLSRRCSESPTSEASVFTSFVPCEASKHPAYQPCAVIALVVPPAGIVIALLYLGSSLSLDRALGHALIWRSFILPGVVLTVYYLVYLLLLLTPQGRAWVS